MPLKISSDYKIYGLPNRLEIGHGTGYQKVCSDCELCRLKKTRITEVWVHLDDNYIIITFHLVFNWIIVI